MTTNHGPSGGTHHNRTTYGHELDDWPNSRWDEEAITPMTSWPADHRPDSRLRLEQEFQHRRTRMNRP